MSDFYDTIQEDENARQSTRVRAYPPNDRSNRSVPTNQTNQIREPSRRAQLCEEQEDEDDFFAAPQPQRRPQPAPTQQSRYASEQNLSSNNGNARRQVAGGSGHVDYNPYSRYSSQASIANVSRRNPYFEKANEYKSSSNTRSATWEEEDDDEHSFTLPRSQPPPQQPRQQQPHSRFQNQQQEAPVNQRNPIHTFASDLRQGLQETSDISTGRTQANGAPSRHPVAKPAASKFYEFESDDDEGEQVLRQTAEPQQQQARPELRQNGSYSAFGHREQQQQGRPDRNMYYGSSRNREGPPSDGCRDPREKREKFKPTFQNATELFDERMHIQKGERFDEVYGDDRDFDVQVTGGDDTKPRIESFDECDFSPQILRNLQLLRFSKPTPIQKYVIPLVQRKTNSIMGNAETGSGKTAAFIVPIINEIQHKKKTIGLSSKGGLPYCLVLEPTRDLAEQVHRDTSGFANQTGVVITVTYGETNVYEAKREIERGCDILVMTIGRLRHFLEEGIIKLTNMHYLILDETDKLLKSQFEAVIVDMIIKSPDLKPDYRTFMFSATIDEDVQRFISQNVPENAFCVSVGEVNHAASTINQKFIKVGKYDKEDFLLEILRDSESTIKRKVPGDGDKFEYIPERTIVFVGQKRQSDRVAISLAREGFNVISLNADRTAKQRWEAIYKYKMNTYQVLVATDVASRGLNLPEVQHVINLDLPQQEYMSYIHRIGRTGRAGNTGHATSFFDPNCTADIENTPFYVQTLQYAKIQVPDFMQEIVDNRNQTVHALNRVDPRSAQQNWD